MSTGQTAARERISDLCRGERDSRRLRARVLSEIENLLQFDFYVWVLTDPETRVGSAPLARVPDLSVLPRLIGLKYATAVNRWTALTPNTCRTLAQATAGQLSRSLLWQQLLHGYGVTDMASMVFADQFGCWGFLDLWRCGGRPGEFSPQEQTELGSLGAELTTAIRACQAATFTGSPSSTDANTGPTVLLLSAGLVLINQTPQSEAHLRQLLPTPAGATPIPAAAYNVAAQLLAIEAGVDSAPAQARTHLSGTRWLTLRAARLDHDNHPEQAAIAVTVEPIQPWARIELYARTAGLTPRETELLHRLSRGLSTRELAKEMKLSPNTVPDHLKAIFTKTNTNSRSAVVARALGAQSISDPS